MTQPIRWNMNPIVVKEIRSRMRGARAFITLTIVLVLLSAFGYAVARLTVAGSQYTSSPISPLIGQTVFAGLAFLLLFIVCAITPAVTANAISDEKEKLTFEMLLTTPLHPVSILWGKLVASLSYIFLIIFAAVPLTSLVFIYGGVTIRDLIKTGLTLLSIGVMVGVIGLFMSALLGRSGRAIAATYIVVMIMVFGPLLLSAGLGILRQSEPPRMVMMLSPVSALASAMSPSVNPLNLYNLSWMFGGAYWIMAPAPISLDSIPRPLYHYSFPLYLGLTLVLYLWASRLILPARRWRAQWMEWLLAVVIIIGFLGLVALGYGLTSNRYENILISNPTSTPTPFLEIPPVPPASENQPAEPDISPTVQPSSFSRNIYNPQEALN